MRWSSTQSWLAFRPAGGGPVRRFVATLTRVTLAASLGAVVLVAIVTASPASASGVGFNHGDVFVGAGNGTVAHYSSSGTLLDTLPGIGTYETGMCFNGAGDLYATDFSGGSVTKFGAQGQVAQSSWATTSGGNPESCVVDANGDVYVGSVDPGKLEKFSSSGSLLATYSPAVEARGVDWIDLASDQCTIYYSSEGSTIARFNACTDSQLPAFTTNLPAPCFSLRILANAEVLIACQSEVLLLGTSGNVVHQFPGSSLPGAVDLFALTLDPDGTSFWVGDYGNNNVYNVALASGNVLEHFTNPSGVWGLAVFTASGVASGPESGSESLGSGNPSENNTQCTSGAWPVNCATGNFYHQFHDVKVPGRGLALDLTRTYNSLAASNQGMFGNGWASSYSMNLSVDTTTGNVTVAQENGSAITFNPVGSGGFIAPARVLAMLAKNPDGTYTLTRRQTERFEFSSTGQLTSESDLNGYVTTLAYNSSGQLATVTDPAGRSLGFTYGSNGLVSSVTDPAGQVTSYGYDTAGDLTSVTDPMGRTTSFIYDPNHLLVTLTDPDGGVVTNHYDSTGRVISQTDPAGLATTFSYSGSPTTGAGGSTTITDPHNNVETEQYRDGQLMTLTKGSGTASPSTWTYTYSPYGPVTIVDPNGHRTSNSYDGNGNLLSATDALGNTTTSTYNGFDEPLTVTDPAGIVTSNSYDANGNLLTKSISGLSSATSFGPWSKATADSSYSPTAIACPSTTLCVAGDAGGDILVSTNPAAGSWSNYGRIGSNAITAVSCALTGPDATYACTASDAAGELLQSQDPAGGAATWRVGAPDPGIPLTGVSCPTAYLCAAVDREGDIIANGSLWSHVDGFNPLTSISCPSTTLCVAADGAGNIVVSTAPFTDSAAAWTVEKGVDGSNALTAISCPSTALCVATDSQGNIFSSENPAGGTGQWMLNRHVDGTNTLTAISCPSTTLCVATDGVGDAAISADPTGGVPAWTVTAGVDPSTDLSGVSCASASLCVAVDKRGNAMVNSPSTSSSSLTATWQLTYGDAGHLGDLTQVTDPDGHVVTYAHDAYGDVSSTTTSPMRGVAETTNDVYDIVGHKVCEASPNAVAAVISCPAAGSPTRIAGTSTWAYDPDGEVTTATDPLGNTTSSSYDANGNVTETQYPAGDVTRTAYDADDRPTTVTNGTGATVSTTAYGYDLVPGTGACSGSVAGATYCTTTTSPLGALTVTYFDAQNRVVAETQPASGTTTSTYGLAGNLLTQNSPGGSVRYSYDADNRVTAVANSAASGFVAAPDVTYAYGTDGRRLQMTDGTGTTSYAYDALGRLANSTNGAGATTAYGYDPDGNVTTLGYPNGFDITRGYDGTGRLVSVADWNANTTTFSYDHNGNLTGENLPNGVASTSRVNAANQMTASSDAPASSPSTPFATFAYTRSADGQVATEQDTGMPQPGTQAYGYDTQSRLATDSTGPYNYDAGGDLVTMPNGTTQAFGAGGQLRSSTQSGGAPTTYGYDTQGNRTTTTVAGSGTSTFAFNQNNRLVSAAGAIYSYNGDGLRMSKTMAGKQTEPFAWDTSGAQPLMLADGTMNYIYGPGGLPLEQLATPGPVLVGTTTDEAQVATTQLASSTVSVGMPTGIDPGDQLLVGVTEDAGQSASIAGYTQVGSWSTGLGAQLQVFSHTAAGTETSVNVVFGATNDAHPVAIVVADYRGVDPERPVDVATGTTSSATTITVPSATTTQSNDRLVAFQGALNNPSGTGWGAPSDMTERTQVSQSSLVAAGMADTVAPAAGPSGTQTSTFNGTSVSLAAAVIALRPAQPLYYLHDQLGSTRALVDSHGVVVASYTFSPLGQELATTGSPAALGSNPFGYAGQYTDPESGMVYLINRYYDPATGQFLSLDPLVAITGAPYSYAGDNPVNSADPLGLCNSDVFTGSFWTGGNCLSGLIGSPDGGGGESLGGVAKSVAEIALAATVIAATWTVAGVPVLAAFETATAGGAAAVAAEAASGSAWGVTFPFDSVIVGGTLGLAGLGVVGLELGALGWLINSLGHIALRPADGGGARCQ